MTDLSDSLTVVKAAGVNVLGMVAKSSRALVTIFVTRVSGPATFGLFMLLVAVVELVTRFTIFGMDKSILKFVPEGHDARTYRVLSTVFATGLALGTAATLGIVFGATWIGELWLNESGLEPLLRLTALAVVPLTLVTLLLAATKALKIMRYDAYVAGLVMPLGMLALSVPILWTDEDVRTLILAYVASTLVGCGIALWFYGRHFSVARSLRVGGGETAREVLRFSTPLGAHDFVQYLAIKLELFLLAYFVTPAELGVYALASEIAFVLKKIRQTVDPIMIPLMSEARSRGQRDRMADQLRRVIRWLMLIGVPYVSALALFPEPLLGLFGEAFVAGGTVLVLLCLAQLLNVSTAVLDMAMLAAGRPRINLINVTVLLVTQTALNLWLIPRYGIVGAAAAALAAFAVLTVVRLLESVHLLGISPLGRSQLKPVAAGIGAGLPVFALATWGPEALPWPALLVGFFAAYWSLLKVQGIDPEDAALVRSILGR